MLTFRIVLGLSTVLTIACGSKITTVEDDGGSTTVGAGGGGAGTPNSAPTVSLSVAPATINEEGSATFRAVVTDPDGAQDIQGGVLRDEMGSVTYGSLARAADGSYSLTITWDQLNAVAPITFTAPHGVVFEAQFSDSADHVGTARATLMLSCSNGCGATNGICGCGSICMIDCTTISTPDCLLSVCNDGMYQGVIGECVIIEAPNGTPCSNGSCQSGQCI